MLIYVESKSFPYRTFVVRAQPHDTIARVRAQLLHILYEIGRDETQFRLRFNGEYLRDAYTVTDYELVEGAVLKMIPIGTINESLSDFGSVTSGSRSDVRTSFLPDIKNALEKEVRIFDRREEMLFHFKGLLFLHFMAACLCFLTTYWFSGTWTLVLWLWAVYYCPTFTRYGGYIGGASFYKERFCIVYGVGALVCLAASLYFCSAEWILIVDHGCKDWDFVDNCSHKKVFSAIFYGFHALLFLISMVLAFTILGNMRVKYGDYVERYLVQCRDIQYVMKSARSGRTKEKRVAAFELATMAAMGDDNKSRIVAEGGLEILIRMALSNDEVTKEHAVEAIAEMLTVPSILDQFVELGGVQTLSTLLHTSSPQLLYQVSSALSYIIADSEEHKLALASDQGLSDLSRAAQTDVVANQRVIAGIFLELAFNSEVRGQMASLNTPAEALIKLCRSADPETQRFALQTLELLAIESPEMIRAQEALLKLVVELPLDNYDHKILLLAGKLLLYYAEHGESCAMLLDVPRFKDSLLKFARTKNAILQKVTVKVIYHILENSELRFRVAEDGLEEVLHYVRDHAVDRECWDMADQALDYTTDPDDSPTPSISHLPALTTAEKVDKMDPQKKVASVRAEFGSKTSLRSRGSYGVSNSDLPVKKGID